MMLTKSSHSDFMLLGLLTLFLMAGEWVGG
jgi:hypothetical protein